MQRRVRLVTLKTVRIPTSLSGALVLSLLVGCGGDGVAAPDEAVTLTPTSVETHWGFFVEPLP